MTLKKLHLIFITLTLLTLLLIGGCVSKKSTDMVSPVSYQQLKGFEVKFSISKSTFFSGEEVPLKLNIKNTGDNPQKLSFTSGQEYEFLVNDDSGNEVWRWSYGKVFAMILREKKLEPGEELVYEVVWPQENFEGERVPVGSYVVKGYSTSDELREIILDLEIKIVD
ncbi:BsuPI-related putative proteinase inhibitor [Candidatus Oleimmundimicrobium sp.]|uniref:BsuPI-related putative proteinase inhibitor n=1 Tax=Candidatus Oleimmundimicrobium sp. TaxID=3060597 RepID=UPI002729226F|nr:BsuPI-related putative proteinase inhibitor [Candidatus Oleimmundimicrobium sp.]MDO8886019.1 BsuPI-related putative proteinase inhibitor [Candidatus Oleimmundimicrobium sp.]